MSWKASRKGTCPIPGCRDCFRGGPRRVPSSTRREVYLNEDLPVKSDKISWQRQWAVAVAVGSGSRHCYCPLPLPTSYPLPAREAQLHVEREAGVLLGIRVHVVHQ